MEPAGTGTIAGGRRRRSSGALRMANQVAHRGAPPLTSVTTRGGDDEEELTDVSGGERRPGGTVSQPCRTMTPTGREVLDSPLRSPHATSSSTVVNWRGERLAAHVPSGMACPSAGPSPETSPRRSRGPGRGQGRQRRQREQQQEPTAWSQQQSLPVSALSSEPQPISQEVRRSPRLLVKSQSRLTSI